MNKKEIINKLENAYVAFTNLELNAQNADFPDGMRQLRNICKDNLIELKKVIIKIKNESKQINPIDEYLIRTMLQCDITTIPQKEIDASILRIKNEMKKFNSAVKHIKD